MTDKQQRADELWAALNIAGMDGEMPDAATTARLASAYRAALDAAEARGRAQRDEVWRTAITALMAEWDSPEVAGGREIAADMCALMHEVTR